MLRWQERSRLVRHGRIGLTAYEVTRVAVCREYAALYSTRVVTTALCKAQKGDSDYTGIP